MSARRPPQHHESAATLPRPDPRARAHSDAVLQRVKAEIDAAGGPISFARYMELVLYEPGLGYYATGIARLDADGDFVTAPELSELFAGTMARPVAQALRAFDGGRVLELGPGSGALAAGLLAQLQRLDALPRSYQLLEVSAALRARQRQCLEQRIPGLLPRVEWLDRLPEGGEPTVVLGNEVLDAMPVWLFRKARDGLRERCVGRAGDGLAWVERPAGRELAAAVARLEERCGPLPEGYRSEINLRLEAWMRGLGGVAERLLLLLIDYGYASCEYYLPERVEGTLMCYYRQRAHDDPLRSPGLQDITAHVDFEAVAAAAGAAGLEVLGYRDQGGYLLDSGLLDRAEDGADPGSEEWLRRAQQIKTLTLPSQMGERFKVVALGRGLRFQPLGFAGGRQRLPA